jgi:ArsR family transcriptional regulator
MLTRDATPAKPGRRSERPSAGRMFRAFSDGTRLRILHLLEDRREVCVGDLVAALRAPQTTVSRHLAYLRRSGLVRVRKDGLWKHYSLAPPGGPLHQALLRCLRCCADEVPELAADRRRFERLDGCCPR